jgi:hypothetical protein
MNWEAAAAIGEIGGAMAVVVSLIYLAKQVSMSNRLARADAFRNPNSELNSLNTAFGLNPIFRTAFRKAINGAVRTELETDECTVIDFYLISATNIYDQLSREVREGILDDEALDFGGKGLFLLQYYRTSWPLYRDHFDSTLVREFEERYEFDPSLEAKW